MHLLDREALAELMRDHRSPSVSLFLSSTRVHGRGAQDRIRFKNLLREAEGSLVARGLRTAEIDELFEPAQRLIADDLFWGSITAGLAVFISPGSFRYFDVPVAVDELAIVNDRPYVKPLLDHLAAEGNYYLLALSHNAVRFFKGSRRGLAEVQVEGMPKGRMRDVLGIDGDQEQNIFRSSTSQPSGGQAMFHGHGGAPDVSNDELRRYCIRIDDALHEVLRNERAPLVLAGVEYLFPVFRDAGSYQHIAPDGVPGNPEGMSADELHAKAWPIVEPILLADRNAAIARFHELAGKAGGRASSDLGEIVPAARYGRVDALFVALDAQQWGRFDEATNTIHLRAEPASDDQDLLDFAAAETLLNGGTVYAMGSERVPGSHIAALFRF